MNIARVLAKHPNNRMSDAPQAENKTRMVVADRSFDDVMDGLKQVARSAQPTSTQASHSVRRGDTLTAICRDFLAGQGKSASPLAVHDAVRQVAAQNGLSDPDLIYPGQQIDLSSIASASRPVMAQAPAKPIKARGGPTPLPMVATGLQGIRRAAAKSVNFASATAPKSLSDATAMLESVAKSVPVRQAVNTISPARPWESVLDGTGVLTSPFGMRRDPFTGQPAFHKGIDIAAARGSDIQAYEDGEVVFSGWKGGYGNLVILQHPNGLETRYGHASALGVKAGDIVKAGQSIGEVGSTGRSTGNHLHFEVRVAGEPVNPLPYLKNRSNLQIAEAF